MRLKTKSISLMLERTTEMSERTSVALRVVSIILTLFFFLFCINLMVASLGTYASDFEQRILTSALNPFIGLFIGLLVTAVIQSSSTTSTMVVAMVATGTLTIHEAIPIIMGANIGTTLTSTIVSLGFISDKKAFRKGVSAGVIHDFYNIILVLVLFPLEYYYEFLSKLSIKLNSVFIGKNVSESGEGFRGFMDFGLADNIVALGPKNILMLVLSFILLFISIKLLTSVIKRTAIGDSKNRLRKFVFNKPLKSFGWGVLITSAIQSSSVSTSLMVPLVATEKVRLRNAFPFIIGANLGTTITALIAASFGSETAMSIAIAHLLFNLMGALIFMLSTRLRETMVNFIKKFSIVMTQKRVIGLSYIIITFFLLPFLLITLNKQMKKGDETAKELSEQIFITNINE